MLLTLAALLGAATIAVPISRWLGFGSVLGYLVAGIVIGPQTLGLVQEVNQIAGIAQLGVIMLLFLIGLELRPQRLWVMRKAVFGLGPAQVAVTGAALLVCGHIAGLDWPAASVVGIGFALSSTAIVLPMLGERDLLGTRAGRDTFAVLLFQDLAFIPLVAIVPALAGGDVPDRVPWHDVARGAAAIGAILVGGRFLLNPVLRLVAGLKTPEVFTAAALLIVVGAAALCEAVGLSLSLGAFLAGVLLSDSDYRHELRADIEPFEGLLLGFFFISVGMQVDLRLALTHPGTLVVGVFVLMAVKLIIASGVGMALGQNLKQALRFGLALPQGSEFSFVLFGAAVSADALASDVSNFATLVVAASIVMTPIVFAASESFIIPRIGAAKLEPVYDAIDGADADIIICGFGRVGQIVGRILHMHRIPFTALEKDPGQVDVVRRLGRQVFFGDPSRVDVLRAAGAGSAKLLIVALAEIDETVATVEIARREFPQLKILARARNRFHAHLLMDRGVDGFVRETFYSSLRLSEMALTELGISQEDAAKAVQLFAEHDTKTLLSTHAIYRDESRLIQSAQEATQELEQLFEADQEETAKAAE